MNLLKNLKYKIRKNVTGFDPVTFFCRNIKEEIGRNIFTNERMFDIIKGEYTFGIKYKGCVI